MVEPLSEAEEQRIRDEFGYAPSERRTKAERDAAAARMTGKPWDANDRKVKQRWRERGLRGEAPPPHSEKAALAGWYEGVLERQARAEAARARRMRVQQADFLRRNR